jgi:membrane-associated phospholipid phosphatase
VEAGGGISAMPSIHVTVAILYILAAQRTRWSIPAIVFGLLTFIGSIHFGYHYAIDGFVGMAVAQLCWRCAGLCYDRRRVAIGEPAKSASVSTLPVQGSMSPPEPVSVLVRAA